jgi:mRNA-degrading endonuclease RelE of RelBE toxin-antitoxin system
MASLSRIQLAPRAARDLRKLDRQVRTRVRRALEQLATGAENLDLKAISGHPGWLRLRVGEHRVLCRPLGPKESDEQPAWLIARIVDRKELERAVTKLP